MSSDSLDKTPKVFISYSWSSSDKVLELAKRLLANGVEVVLDKWDLKEGQDKYYFMEQSVNNPEIDKVLIICDKAYADKANSREGGVGDETVIISSDIYGKVEQEKFIPIIFEVDVDGTPYCPAYIQSRIYIDLSSEDEKYETSYEMLLRNIHKKPLYRKPAIGTIPEWLEPETIDLSAVRDTIKQIRGYVGGNKSKADYLVRKFNDEFISALLSIESEMDIPKDDALLLHIDAEKPLRDLFIDYLEAVICSDLQVGEIVPAFLEQAFNSTHDAGENNDYSHSDFEFFDFVLWEILICTVSVLLHYEKYTSLNQILTHTYFLREGFFSTQLRVTDYTYAIFRKYCYTIEKVCKPKCDEPRYFTLAGEILVKREKKPIITKASLVNADVVLYQMSQALGLPDTWFWFPETYHHCRVPQPMWQKLKSKAYCKKIMPLFGATTIEELKSSIVRNKEDGRPRHAGSFDYAAIILNSVELDKIGGVN